MLPEVRRVWVAKVGGGGGGGEGSRKREKAPESESGDGGRSEEAIVGLCDCWRGEWWDGALFGWGACVAL